MFRIFGILDRVKWLIVEKSKYGSRIGCFKSHLQCLRKSSKDIVIVFEDDTTISNNSITWDLILHDVKEYLKIYDFFGIGCIMLPLTKKYNKPMFNTRIVEKKDFNTLTCYAMTQECIQKVCPRLKKIIRNKKLRSHPQIHIDMCLNVLIPQVKKCGYECPQMVQNDIFETDNIWMPTISNKLVSNCREKIEHVLRKYVDNVFTMKDISTTQMNLMNIVSIINSVSLVALMQCYLK